MVMFESGSSVWLEEDFDMLAQVNALSKSAIATEMLFSAVSWSVDWFETSEIVGASFAGVTDNEKVLDAARAPSEMVKVTSELPFALATGAIVPTQFGHAPLQATAPLAATIEALVEV